MSRTERLAQPEQFGKYQLVARLAHGRMGDVYKAKVHGVEGFERILVVKTIHPGYAAVPGFLDVVVEEAQRAVLLSHANVAQVLNLGQEEEQQRAFLATEYVNGLDLERAMQIARGAQTAWPMEISVFIAAEIANGLDYAHRRKDYNFNLLNIMHRDLGPTNVMLSNDGDVKVSDFGVSRAMTLIPPNDDQERLRRVLYQAPESVRSNTQHYTQQSDIFSLGLLLYEMLAGIHPYLTTTRDADQVEQLAAQGAIPPISNFGNVPRPLVQIVESMLVTDPAGRAPSAGQVYEELCGFIYGNNLPRSDARALSVFVEELRKHEQQLFPEDMSQEVGFDEISMSELQVPEAAQSLYGDLDPNSPPPPPTGSAPPMPPMAPISEATSDELPRQKIAKLMQADEAASGSYQLPGPLEEYFRATRAGRGKAVILYGQLGVGREYLPDRLQDVLGVRGNTLISTTQCVRDDQYRPFGALGDAIVQSLEQYLSPDLPPLEATLEYLRGLGVDSETIAELEEVWGFGHGVRAGIEVKRAHLVRFCSVAVQELCKRHTPVYIFDRVELMDSLSLDVLRDLLSTIGALPTMVILGTQRVEHMRRALDTGNPEHLGAARVVGKEAPKLSEIGELDDDSRSTLAALAMMHYPLDQSTLVRLLGIPSDRLLNALKGLVERGLVRVPKTGHFMPGIPDLSPWLEENFTHQERHQIACSLLRMVQHQQPQELPKQDLPIRARLLAMSHERRPFLAAIDEHVDELRRAGFYHIAVGFYRYANELLTAETIGLPAARLEYMLSRAELALELSMLEECRQSIGPITALSETMRNERGSVRSLLLQGQMAMHQDDLDEAREWFKRAIDGARALADPDLLARSMVAMAGWFERYGDNLAGQRQLEGAMNLYHRWGTRRMDMYSRAQMINRAVNMWCNRGMYTRAVNLVEDLRRMAQISGLASLDCRVEWAQARIQAARGDSEHARRMIAQATEFAKQHRLNALHMELIRQHASIALDANDYEGSLGLLNELLFLSDRFGDQYSHQRALDMRAFAQTMLHIDTSESLAQLKQSLARAEQRSVPKDIYRCHNFLQRAYTHLGKVALAREHENGARFIAQRMRYHHSAA